MSGVATAIVGGAVIGAIASNNAAGKVSSATNHATDVQSAQAAQTREDLAPWRAAGSTALGQMSALTANGGEFNHNFSLADYQADPGFQFRMDQGNQAIQRSAAARGSLLSGGTLKSLASYSQGLASQEYGAAYNRFNNDRSQRFNQLASLAGLGQTANGQTATSGMNAANNISANTIAGGNAAASGSLGIANAVGSGVNNYMNYTTMQGLMNNPNGANYNQYTGTNTGYTNTNPSGGALYGSGNGGTEYIP